jgi:hypothetical protein
LFTTIESPSGPARLSSETPVKFTAVGTDSSAILPDGRLWTTVSYPRINSENLFRGPVNMDNSATAQFLDGTNWTEMGPGIGVRSDGTAWSVQTIFVGGIVPNNFRPEVSSIQIGTDEDWTQVANPAYGPFSLLLKKDGSLWHYDGGQYAHGHYVTSDPERIGKDTGWMKITSGYAAQLEKSDGSVWDFHAKLTETDFDFHVTKSLYPEAASIVDLLYRSIEVDTNGNLWALSNPPKDWRWSFGKGIPAFATKTRFGGDIKWKSLTRTFGGRFMIIGLRSDGTLWEWPISWTHDFDITKIRPRQLGNYSGWVALPSNEDFNGVALAADGSVWSWNQPSDSYWLTPSRKPAYLENIFTATNSESSQ